MPEFPHLTLRPKSVADQGGDAGKAPHKSGIDLRALLPFSLLSFLFAVMQLTFDQHEGGESGDLPSRVRATPNLLLARPRLGTVNGVDSSVYLTFLPQ